MGPEALGSWDTDRQSPFERVRILDPQQMPAMVQEGTGRDAQRVSGTRQHKKLAQAWGGMTTAPRTLFR